MSLEAAGNLARETGIFSLYFAPATVVTFATTNYDELMRSPWFVVAKIILINVLLPTAFAIWRVIRKQRNDEAEIGALTARATRQALIITRLDNLIGRLPLTVEEQIERRAIMFELESESGNNERSKLTN